MPSPEFQHSGDRREFDNKTTVLDYDGLNTLVRDNQSTQTVSAVNMESLFGPDGRFFSPDAWQSIHVVRVKTAVGFKEFIRDGNHRASGLLTFWQPIHNRWPDFIPEKKDVTDVALGKFFEPDDPEKPDYLTVAQFWLDNTEHTRKHSDIEQQRTMGNLLTGWEYLVGHAIADVYSGFTAVAMITDKEARIAEWSGPGIENYLRTLLQDEPQADQLIPALVGMNTVLKTVVDQSHEGGGGRISYDDLLKETVLLVGPKAEYIGGKDAGQKQLERITNHPLIQQKLEGRDATSLQYGLIDAFRRFGLNIPLRFEDIYAALIDPQFTYAESIMITNAVNPHTKFNQVKDRIERDERVADFTERYGREPTELEVSLLGRKGRYRLGEMTVNEIGPLVQETDKVIANLAGKTDSRSIAARSLLQSRRSDVLNPKRTKNHRDDISTLRRALTSVIVGERVALPEDTTRSATGRAEEINAELGEVVGTLRLEKAAAIFRADKAEERAAGLEQQVAELTRRLEDGETQPNVVVEAVAEPVDIAALRTDLAAAIARAERAEDEVAQQDDTIAQLTGQVAGFEAKRTTAERTIAELTGQLEKARSTAGNVTELEAALRRKDTDIQAKERLLGFKDTAIAAKDEEIRGLKDRLNEEVAARRELEADLTRLSEQPMADEAPASGVIFLSPTPKAPSSPPPKVDPEPREPAHYDHAFAETLDQKAQKIFTPLAPIWTRVHNELLSYAGYTGLDAIGVSLVERIKTIMMQSGRGDTTAWTIDSPMINALIAQHYGTLIKRAANQDRTKSTVDRSINAHRKEVTIPESKIVTQVMQILLYSEPDDPIRERCFRFLKAKKINMSYGANTVMTFEATSGMKLDKYLEGVFARSL